MRIIIVKRITDLMRFNGRETDAQKQTAGYELSVNNGILCLIVLKQEGKYGMINLEGKKVVIAPILRAGLGMVDGLTELMPSARIGHIGMYRDEDTCQPVFYYYKMPAGKDRLVIVTDPMLATGNSLTEAIRLYVEKGIPETNICCVCIISSPQGIENVFNQFPAIKLIVAAVDSHLNERGYIVPGMGDAGDRIYNT